VSQDLKVHVCSNYASTKNNIPHSESSEYQWLAIIDVAVRSRFATQRVVGFHASRLCAKAQTSEIRSVNDTASYFSTSYNVYITLKNIIAKSDALDRKLNVRLNCDRLWSGINTSNFQDTDASVITLRSRE